MKSKCAFTLAEVLITLTILGVVAAITVPVLQQQNYKRTQVTKLAKAYSVLERAVASWAEKSGCIGKDISCTKAFNYSFGFADSGEKFFSEDLGMKILTEKRNFNQLVYPLHCEKNSDSCGDGSYLFYFMDNYDNIGYGISKSVNCFIKDTSHEESCFIVSVITDSKKTSAKKGTEKLIRGRDVFYFLIYGNFNVSPMASCIFGRVCIPSTIGVASIDEYCSPTTPSGVPSRNGEACAAKIIKDGWKMKY